MKRSFFSRHRFLVIVGILFAIYIGVTLVRQEYKYRQLVQQQETYEQQIDTLHADIQELEEELEHSTSPETIERIAREKLKMVKPNEIIYIIQSEEDGEE